MFVIDSSGDLKHVWELSLDVIVDNEIEITAKQHDDNSRYLLITLTADGETVEIPSDYTPYLRGLKADGWGTLTAGTIENGKAYIELTDSALFAAGKMKADVAVEANGEIILSTMPFSIDVVAAPYDGNDIPQSPDMMSIIIREIGDAARAASDNAARALNARMDTFTRLAEGSTTGDAELTDGRVDYTGKIWGSIGSAIRGAYQHDMRFTDINEDNADAYGNSCDGFPMQSIVYADPDWCDDLPSENIFWVITYANSTEEDRYSMQIGYRASDGKKYIRIRMEDESWTDWQSYEESYDKFRLNEYVAFVPLATVPVPFYFESSGHDLYIKQLGQMYLRGRMNVDVSTSKINNDLESTVTSPSGVTGCFKISHNNSLVYNKTESKFKTVPLIVTSMANSLDEEVVIFGVSMARVVNGIGLYLYSESLTKSLKESYDKSRLNGYVAFVPLATVPVPFYFESSSHDLYIKQLGEMYLRGRMSAEISTGDINTDIESSVTSPAGVTGCFKISHNNMLVYSKTESKFKVVSLVVTNMTDSLDEEIVIFGVSMGRVVSGLGLYLYTESLSNTRLAALETETGALPDYWNTYLGTKIDSVKSLVETSDDTFAFVTDIHSPNNALYSPAIIKHLQKYADVSKVMVGGDFITSASSARAATDMIDAWADGAENDWMFTRGNHDSNYQGTGDVTCKAFYERYIKPNKNMIPMQVGKATYYVDDETAKFRYIVLDTCNESSDEIPIADQVTWMQSKITELESSWNVIVMTHKYWAPSLITAGITDVEDMPIEVSAVKTGLDAVAGTADATIIAYICGHVHRDLAIQSDAGYWIISTTCDAASGTQASDWDIFYPTRTRGTKDEQVIDVFGIDTVNRKIKTVRIGAGLATGREFTY